MRALKKIACDKLELLILVATLEIRVAIFLFEMVCFAFVCRYEIMGIEKNDEMWYNMCIILIRETLSREQM